MSATPELSSDQNHWVQWRAQRLRVAEFPRGLAWQLARDDRIDLHAVLELTDRGCPPDLAARIVAPLDSEPNRR